MPYHHQLARSGGVEYNCGKSGSNEGKVDEKVMEGSHRACRLSGDAMPS